jgi:hypothetical protein
MALLLVAAITAVARFGARSTEVSKAAETTTIPTNVPSETSPPVQERLTDEAPADIQVVLLALRSDGFEPAEIKLAAGEYLFVVRNRSGLDEVNVRLFRGNSEQLRSGKVGARRNDWKQRIQLTPGNYVLTETGHPEWTCRIEVTR